MSSSRHMLGRFGRRKKETTEKTPSVIQSPAPETSSVDNNEKTKAEVSGQRLPRFNHNGHQVSRGIHPDGESGRGWIHPWHFLRICFRSSCTASKCVNILWPFVPAAIAIHFARTEAHTWCFALNYVAMVPTANLIGFAGQELARKLPKVIGVLLETLLGSIVELVVFMVLLQQNNENDNMIPVIQAAILGSILANLLLCLGTCFVVGGLLREKQSFDAAISEVGSGLLLIAAFGLTIPCAFSTSIGTGTMDPEVMQDSILKISRATAVILLLAYLVFVWFQMKTHHSVYQDLLEEEEQRDEDRHLDLLKDKLTFTECIVALIIALACVSMHAVFLVKEIDYIKERGVSDMILGLILIPVVEKAAEHLTAVDEAWDNQMSLALAHVLGATVQTALFNSSLVVIVGWCLNKNMNLDFELFQVVTLILAILVVGSFLRDGESNYLEGSLCVLIYAIIGVAAWYYPSPSIEDSATQTTAFGYTPQSSGSATG